MIFPVSVSCITNFEWYEDGSTQVFENVTRASSYSYNLGDSFYVWTNNLLSETLRETVLINFFASVLFLYILKKIFFLQKKINNRTKNIKNLFILVSLLFFIFSGPIPRYLIGLLLFIVAVQAINITSFKYEMNVLTVKSAQRMLSSIDGALLSVDAERGTLGATMNRMQYTIDNLSNIVMNTQVSKGRISDADMAEESVNLSKSQILQQAATAMLAQANQSMQSVLDLLR